MSQGTKVTRQPTSIYDQLKTQEQVKYLAQKITITLRTKMNFWNDLDGSSFFNRIFSSPIPIGEVTLFSLNIDNNRPTIILEFDIKEYPEEPPTKWKQSGFNTCRIGLNCSNIEGVSIKNIPTKKI